MEYRTKRANIWAICPFDRNISKFILVTFNGLNMIKKKRFVCRRTYATTTNRFIIRTEHQIVCILVEPIRVLYLERLLIKPALMAVWHETSPKMCIITPMAEDGSDINRLKHLLFSANRPISCGDSLWNRLNQCHGIHKCTWSMECWLDRLIAHKKIGYYLHYKWLMLRNFQHE